MGHGYALSLVPPRGWRQVDVSPAGRRREIERQLRQLRHVVPAWREIGPSLRRYLAGAYEDAWKSGVRLALATDARPDDMVRIMATFMVAMLPPASPLGDMDEELDAVAEGLIAERDGMAEGEALSLGKVSLPGLGDAIQAQSLTALTGPDGVKTDRRVAMLRTFVPFDGHVFVATGMTPQLDVADVMFELFAAVTGTLGIRRLDDAAPAAPGPRSGE